MAIAMSLKAYLDDQGIPYEPVHHAHTASSMETARAAGIAMEKLAKAVIFRDEHHHYWMAVMPARCRAEISSLNLLVNHDLSLAEERELPSLFDDCEPGAVPPVGAAYSLPTVWDEQLEAQDDIYLEAGDHMHLLHLDRDAFTRLMRHNSHGRFSKPHLFAC